MTKEKTKESGNLTHVSNFQTAQKVNELYKKIALREQDIAELHKKTEVYIKEVNKKVEVYEKQRLEAAMHIGKLLHSVREKSKHGDFLKWAEKHITFDQRTVYRYIKLFENKERVADTKNLSEAYKILDRIAEKVKKEEIAKAEKRIDVYKKTGKKSEDWRQHTDDKLAKAKSKSADKNERKESVVYDKSEIQRKLHNLDHKPVKSVKEQDKKQDNAYDDSAFNEILMDYLEQFDNKCRKVIACQNILKMCRRFIDDIS